MRADELKITDLRVADIDGLPKHMILLKLYTNAGIVGYVERHVCQNAQIQNHR